MPCRNYISSKNVSTKRGNRSDFKRKNTNKLLETYATVMEELKQRGAIRSYNNPVSDYAEFMVSRTLNLELSGGSNKGFDARDRHGIRYQIKARRLDGKSSRQLGVFRSLDKNPFDVAIVVLFNHEFQPAEVYRIPIAAIKRHGRFSRHVNGWIVQATPPLTTDGRVRNITRRFIEKRMEALSANRHKVVPKGV